jgi:hypothetical protein
MRWAGTYAVIAESQRASTHCTDCYVLGLCERLSECRSPPFVEATSRHRKLRETHLNEGGRWRSREW